MSQALQRIESTAIVARSLADIREIGKLFAMSGMFNDAQSEARAAVKVMAGAELGLGAFAAMSELHVIKGKVTLSAGLLAKRIKESNRYNYKVKEHSNEICSIDFYEEGEYAGNSTFTIKDAKLAGTQNIDKFPRNMLFARAISNGVKWYCPDVTGAIQVYTHGELDDETPRVMQPGESEADPYAGAITVEPEPEPSPKLDESYVLRITELAEQTGLAPTVAQMLVQKQKETVADLTQEQADKLLSWLETQAAAQKAQAEMMAPATDPEPAPATQEPDPKAWACATPLKIELLTLQKRIEQINHIDAEEAKADIFRIIKQNFGRDITSRKELTDKEAGFLITLFSKQIAEAANE